MINKAIDEFCLIFSNPRDIHRVMMIIPLAALASHMLYLYAAIPAGVPITRDEIISASLLGTIYIMWTSWVFLSNKFDIELFMRFVWCALLSVLAHRLAVLEEPLGGWYVTTVSFMAIGMVMIFVVTGKTKNELKIWFNVKLNEKKDNPPTHHIPNVDDDRPSAGLG